MPELPEVETIRRELAPHLVGRRFASVALSWPRAVKKPAPEEFVRRLVGKTIEGLDRRGKYLIFRLSGGETLILHLKMTGSLIIRPASAAPDQYTRTVFCFDDPLGPFEGPVAGNDYAERLAVPRLSQIKSGRGSGRVGEVAPSLRGHSSPGGRIASLPLASRGNGHRAICLHFRDLRKFGAMWLVRERDEVVGKLGPEPLLPDFTVKRLAAILKIHRTPIKAVLCDQAVIAGIGNMYADEALFAARIHPLKIASNLSPAEVARIHRAMQQVLRKAIEGHGASVDTYFRPDGSQGWAHEDFKVAHRRGELCPRCSTPIQRIVVRQRGTYFCPKCQAR